MLGLSAINQWICQVPQVKTTKIQGHYYNAWFLEGKFSNFIVELSKGPEKRRGTKFLNINPTSLKNFDLIDAIRNKQIACFIKNSGKVETIYVHESWLKRMQKEKALDAIVRDSGNEGYNFLEENDELDLIGLTDEAYLNTLRKMGLGEFIG